MASCSKGGNPDTKIHNDNSKNSNDPAGSKVNYLRQAHGALIGKPILISRQAPEHLNLDYRVKVTVGPTVFTATLHNNPTASAFRERLPLTINMVELNGNEKYFNMENELPLNASNPGTIQAGDLMLYGSKTLVLFYKSFSTPYSYTKIGRIDDASGLATALGSKEVSVTFSE